ncbi:MAG: PKD domain-containing protein [Bacteroidota bacterium]|nr:PKD domain-containing protein [Bacteroidota bacterium]MDP3145703.1 PKD domain-containing protein [Bacteroidota bacterium]
MQRYLIVYIFILFFLGTKVFSQLSENLFIVKKLPLNTKNDEFSFNIIGDKIYYLTNEQVEIGIRNFDKESGKSLFRIVSKNLTNGNNEKPKQLFPEFLKNVHEGPFYINKSQNTVWYTVNDSKKINENKKSITIKKVELENSKWIQKPWQFADTLKGPIGHPYLYDNETKIIFSAEIKGLSYGGMDLYKMELINNLWVNLSNLGPMVNTAGNEAFPYIDSLNKLYYSTNGKDSNKKDYDIYGIDLNALNVPSIKFSYPINSDFNENGFSWNSKTNSGYFSSDRSGNDDIYSATLQWPKTKNCDTSCLSKNCYEFYEQSSAGLDDTTQMGYQWDFGDGFKERGLNVTHCYQNEGVYDVALNIIDKTTGVLFFNQINYALEVLDSFPVRNVISDNKFNWSKKYFVDSVKTAYLEIDGIPFYSGIDTSITIIPNWNSIKEIYTVYINNKLDTVSRINNNINFKKCIKPDFDTLFRVVKNPEISYRIHLGSSKLLYDNVGNNLALNDTITFVNDSIGLIHYYLGNYDDIDSALAPIKNIRDLGFKDVTLIAFEKNKIINGQKLLGRLEDYFHQSGYKLYYSLFYDFGSFLIKKQDKFKLDSLIVNEKRQNNYKFIITSFTDPSGSSEINEQLVQKRTKSVENFLISHQIKKKNILPKKIKFEGDEISELMNLNDSKVLRRTDIYIAYEK